MLSFPKSNLTVSEEAKGLMFVNFYNCPPRDKSQSDLPISNSLYFFPWSEVFRVGFKERNRNTMDRDHKKKNVLSPRKKFFPWDEAILKPLKTRHCANQNSWNLFFQSCFLFACGSLGSRPREYFAEKNDIWWFRLGAMRKSLHPPPTPPFFLSGACVIIELSSSRLSIGISSFPYSASFACILSRSSISGFICLYLLTRISFGSF